MQKIATRKRKVAKRVAILVLSIVIIGLHPDVYQNGKYFLLSFIDQRRVQVQMTHQETRPGVISEGSEYPIPSFVFDKSSSQPVIVLISDTGMDITSTDLNRLIWINPGEVANGADDDGNGCVDDIHGCHFNLWTDDGDVTDGLGHGTHVAGTVAGIPEKTMYVPSDGGIKIASAKFMNDQGWGYIWDAERTIDYGTWLQVHLKVPVVINVSWVCHWMAPASLGQAITRAEQAGVIIVAAAGNDQGKYMSFPAAYSLDHSNVIAVAALNDNNERAEFSNRFADIAAPGVGIVSTAPKGQRVGMDGTSMATPFVTQVVAFLRQLYPTASPAEIKNLLINGSDEKEDLRKDVKGGRILNAKKTLRTK